MDILKQLEKEFSLKTFQVENTVKLIDEGSTIPFIARYRKELTGSIDDQQLREIFDRLEYLRNLEKKRGQVRKTIEEQGGMTGEISASLDKAATLAEIEDIYRPFKPKRRTRATAAREKGLEGLAKTIFAQKTKQSIDELAKGYVSEEKVVDALSRTLTFTQCKG